MKYYHPHGLGDLIMAMPYIEERMYQDKSFQLVVTDSIIKSGYFERFYYGHRVFGGCPKIWDRFHLRVDYSKLYGKFFFTPHGGNRRMELAEFFGVEYNPDVQGKVYAPLVESQGYFSHHLAATPLRSAPPWLFPYDPSIYTCRINEAFSRLHFADKVYVTNSVFLHACGAMWKDIDVLYNPYYFDLKPYLPENIRIKKIVTGNLLDVVGGTIHALMR